MYPKDGYQRHKTSFQKVSFQYTGKTWNKNHQDEYNRCLMVDVNQKTNYSKSPRNHINNCRLYLKVEYLSDVCNQAGTKITEEATDWLNPTTIYKTKKLWPKQACPGKKQLAMFRKFLRSTYSVNSWIYNLAIPLGTWTTHHDERQWIHYHDHEYPAYYHYKNGKWLMWAITPYQDPIMKI